jgi:hypothetical protein
MIYTEFVEMIKKIPASFEKYKEQGLNDTFINQHINRFSLSKKEADINIHESEDELLKLIKSYNLSEISIGMVNFLPAPYENSENVFFGKFEVDTLAIYQPSAEIRCYEENSDHLMYNCAKNGEMFLSALFEASCFLEKRSMDNEMYDNELLALDVAAYCADLAGGSKYKKFYVVLLS